MIAMARFRTWTVVRLVPRWLRRRTSEVGDWVGGFRQLLGRPGTLNRLLVRSEPGADLVNRLCAAAVATFLDCDGCRNRSQHLRFRFRTINDGFREARMRSDHLDLDRVVGLGESGPRFPCVSRGWGKAPLISNPDTVWYGDLVHFRIGIVRFLTHIVTFHEFCVWNRLDK